MNYAPFSTWKVAGPLGRPNGNKMLKLCLTFQLFPKVLMLCQCNLVWLFGGMKGCQQTKSDNSGHHFVWVMPLFFSWKVAGPLERPNGIF